MNLEQKLPKVAVLVLSWNNFEDSASCIRSILSNSYSNLWPILVDNGSTDGSYERLQSTFPTLTFVSNAENIGFSRGCNVGIRLAMKDTACNYFMLLNNDCLLHETGISTAISTLESDSMIGVVTGKVLFKDGSKRIWHAGGQVSKLMARTQCRGFREYDTGQYEKPVDTGWASGAMMIIARKTLNKAGLLPEEYFFGVEEWDYSLSVLAAGLRIRYVPEFVGYHDGDGSHHNHDPKFVYNYYRNKLIFQEKHLHPLLFSVWKLAFLLYLRLGFRRKITQIINTSEFTFKLEEASRVEDLLFAARSALADHGRNKLTEQVLTKFSNDHKKWKAALPARRSVTSHI